MKIRPELKVCLQQHTNLLVLASFPYALYFGFWICLKDQFSTKSQILSVSDFDKEEKPQRVRLWFLRLKLRFCYQNHAIPMPLDGNRTPWYVPRESHIEERAFACHLVDISMFLWPQEYGYSLVKRSSCQVRVILCSTPSFSILFRCRQSGSRVESFDSFLFPRRIAWEIESKSCLRAGGRRPIYFTSFPRSDYQERQLS